MNEEEKRILQEVIKEIDLVKYEVADEFGSYSYHYITNVTFNIKHSDDPKILRKRLADGLKEFKYTLEQYLERLGF